MKTLTFPLVHLNGTSGERLNEAVGDAWQTLHLAYENMKEAAPNGRDFYPLGPDAYTKAAAEHMERLQRVQDVMDELAAIMENVQSQVDAKASRGNWG